MNRQFVRKRILCIAARPDAEPMLSQLRAAGHEVSLVEDLDEAQVLLRAGQFDQAVVPTGELQVLLEERQAWRNSQAEEWRAAAVGLAHDIRNLLAALERSLALLKVQRAEAIGMGDIEGIQHSILTLSAFLQELAEELAGDQSQANVSAVDLEDLLEHAAIAIYPSAHSRGQRLAIDVDESVKTVRADGRKLRRILMKILQYASRRGTEQGMVTVRACREQEDCVLTVSLPGKGITRSELRELFAPAGASEGANLAYEQRLVDEVGGRLWIESESEGTTVSVSLPLEPSRAALPREA